MKSTKKVGSIVGLLLLCNFVNGIIVYQFLQGPVLFSDDFLTTTAVKATEITISIILLFLSSTLSIVIAAILLPIFKKQNSSLAFLYLVLCNLSNRMFLQRIFEEDQGLPQLDSHSYQSEDRTQNFTKRLA